MFSPLISLSFPTEAIRPFDADIMYKVCGVTEIVAVKTALNLETGKDMQRFACKEKLNSRIPLNLLNFLNFLDFLDFPQTSFQFRIEASARGSVRSR